MATAAVVAFVAAVVAVVATVAVAYNKNKSKRSCCILLAIALG